MKYKLLQPAIHYNVLCEVDIPDNVAPEFYAAKLQPGQKLMTMDGIQVATGPSLDDALSTVQDILSDAQDALQDVRDSHAGE